MNLAAQPIRVLFISLMTILVLGYGIFCWQSWLDVQNEEKSQQQYLGSLTAQSTRASFVNQEHALRLIGRRLLQQEVLQQPENGRQVIETAGHTDAAMVGFGLAQADGQLLLVSGVAAGKALPNLAQNENTAQSFIAALDSPNLLPGRNYFMQALQDWVMPIRVALRDAEGKVQAVMAAGNRVSGGSTMLSNLILPENHRVVLLRDDGFTQFIAPISPEHYQDYFKLQVSQTLLQRVRLAEASGTQFDLELPQWPGLQLLGWAEAIPEYHLHALVVFPSRLLTDLWLERVFASFVLFLIMLTVSVVTYLYLNRVQTRHQQELDHQLYHDTLTLLPNRRLLMQHLHSKLDARQRHTPGSLGVMFLDIDDFKKINDTFGHDLGDDLLLQTAIRLQQNLPAEALVARQGGDEFIVVIELKGAETELQNFAEQLISAFQLPIKVGQEGRELISHISIGAVSGKPGRHNADELLRKANAAMHKVKHARKNDVEIYSEQLDYEINRRLQIENRLERAHEEQAFSVVYQPQARCSNGQTQGLEALLRWHDRELGFVSPDEFIPIAEASQQIAQIDNFVIRTACEEIAALRAELGIQISLSVNLSANEIIDDKLPERLLQLIADSGFPAQDFIAEMTETALVADYRAVRRNCEALSKNQIRVSLDDFGTGYSSLSLLHELPVSEIKIDRSFIQNFLNDSYDAALVKSIIAMGHGLGLKVVGEGVETEAHQQLLDQMRCDYFQGYGLARPMKLDELRQFLLAAQPLKSA